MLICRKLLSCFWRAQIRRKNTLWPRVRYTQLQTIFGVWFAKWMWTWSLCSMKLKKSSLYVVLSVHDLRLSCQSNFSIFFERRSCCNWQCFNASLNDIPKIYLPIPLCLREIPIKEHKISKQIKFIITHRCKDSFW